MITTLPGLYLASVGVIKPVVWLVDLTGKVVCSTAMLRFINLLFNCGILYLLYLIICKLHLKEKVIMLFNGITCYYIYNIPKGGKLLFWKASMCALAFVMWYIFH